VTAELRITDSCPACGQQVMIALAPVQPAAGDLVGMTVVVDPRAARLRAADPTADHPCPGPGDLSIQPVAEDHAS
jgi:hypothetical protein